MGVAKRPDIESFTDIPATALKEGVHKSDLIQQEMGMVSDMMQNHLKSLCAKVRGKRALENELGEEIRDLESLSRSMKKLTEMYDRALNDEGSEKERLWREEK